MKRLSNPELFQVLCLDDLAFQQRAANDSRCVRSFVGVTTKNQQIVPESGLTMIDLLLANISLSTWFFEAWAELVEHFHKMNATQWGVLSASTVIFGFLCLKGTGINR